VARTRCQVVSILVDRFGVSKVGESRSLASGFAKSRSPKLRIVKSLVGEPAFAERIGVRHFGIFEDKRSGFFVPEFPKL
jgi:hypothetical protein